MTKYAKHHHCNQDIHSNYRVINNQEDLWDYNRGLWAIIEV